MSAGKPDNKQQASHSLHSVGEAVKYGNDDTSRRQKE